MNREGSFSVIIFVFFSINGVTQLFFNVVQGLSCARNYVEFIDCS